MENLLIDVVQVHVSSLFHISSYIHYVIHQCVIKHKDLFYIFPFFRGGKKNHPLICAYAPSKSNCKPKEYKRGGKDNKRNSYLYHFLMLLGVGQILPMSKTQCKAGHYITQMSQLKTQSSKGGKTSQGYWVELSRFYCLDQV